VLLGFSLARPSSSEPWFFVLRRVRNHFADHGQRIDEFSVFCLENDMHYDETQMQWNVNEFNTSHAYLFFFPQYTGSEVLMNLIASQE
jgi:hypothetical protein